MALKDCEIGGKVRKIRKEKGMTQEQFAKRFHMTQQTLSKYENGKITIPYDRQELADYLEVDRSGLSAEISKLRKEGILECRKNQFRLLSQENKMVQSATTSVLRKGDE